MGCGRMKVACEDGFEVVTKDKGELVALTQWHVDHSHHKTVTEAEVMAMSKRLISTRSHGPNPFSFPSRAAGTSGLSVVTFVVHNGSIGPIRWRGVPRSGNGETRWDADA